MTQEPLTISPLTISPLTISPLTISPLTLPSPPRGEDEGEGGEDSIGTVG